MALRSGTLFARRREAWVLVVPAVCCGRAQRSACLVGCKAGGAHVPQHDPHVVPVRQREEIADLARQRVEWLLVLDQVPKPCRLVASRLRKIGHPGPDARGGLRPLAVTGVTVTGVADGSFAGGGGGAMGGNDPILVFAQRFGCHRLY